MKSPMQGPAASGAQGLGWGAMAPVSAPNEATQPPGPGQQAFARWLSQYQSTKAASGLPPTVGAGAPSTLMAASGTSLQAESKMRLDRAALPPVPAPHPPVATSAGPLAHARPPTPHSDLPLTSSAAPGAANGLARSSTPVHAARPPAKVGPSPSASAGRPSSPAGAAREATNDEPSSATAESKEVEFSTDRGMAKAVVQELQPPPEVSLTDPASVMAWLASLNQPESPASADRREGEALAAAEADPSELALGEAGRSLAKAFGTAGGAGTGSGTEAHDLMSRLSALSQGAGAESPASQGSLAREGHELGIQNLLGAGTWQAAVGESAPGAEARHFTGSLSTPMDSPDFSQALAERVKVWVSGPASLGPMTAELRLNPAEMGPVHIRIEVDGASAQVDFAAVQAHTRQAIESSLPLLHQSLAEAGLSLSGSGVSDQGAGRGWQGSRPSQDPDGARGSGAGPSGLQATAMPSPAGLPGRRGGPLGPGGLDLYA